MNYVILIWAVLLLLGGLVAIGYAIGYVVGYKRGRDRELQRRAKEREEDQQIIRHGEPLRG